ncbi:MAG: DUF1761 domain-containing protein [Ignavibacteriales bacterium]|nr:DUF1761 domain-containing protein [Ignavibacteriales bacterium]
MNNKVSKTNYAAAIVTGLLAFALSLLWYSPFLFGNIWMALRNPPVNPLPGWTMLFAPLREIITAFLASYLITRLEIATWQKGFKLGLVLWFVFYFVQMAGAVLWDNLPWQLGMVHGGDWLMKMLFISIVLSLWLNKKITSNN